jgi:cytochrome P450
MTEAATETKETTTTEPNGLITINRGDPSFMATAYETYAELREKGRVARVELSFGANNGRSDDAQSRFFNGPTYFVSHYDDVVETLLDERFSVDARAQMTREERQKADQGENAFRPIARSLLSIDPPDHTRIRKLVQPSFTGRTMEAMRPAIQGIVDRLLDKAEREAAERGETAPNRRMELISAFAYPFPVTVISDLLGIPQEDRQQIKGWTENLLRADRGRDEALQEEVRQGLRDFTDYLKELFERKRREPGDDMISRMVQAQEDGDVLSEDELLSMAFIMYLAGHVTTVNLVGNGVVALLTHPDQLAKTKSDRTLAKNMVEETLRFWGPVDFVARRFAKHDLEIAGTEIDKGEQLTIGLASANHDPNRFANPEVYDITREDANRHVAFGKGIHVCLGAPLARIEGQIAFETLVRRYPDLRLAAPDEELTWSGNFLRGFRQVPLLF